MLNKGPTRSEGIAGLVLFLFMPDLHKMSAEMHANLKDCTRQFGALTGKIYQNIIQLFHKRKDDVMI